MANNTTIFCKTDSQRLQSDIFQVIENEFYSCKAIIALESEWDKKKSLYIVFIPKRRSAFLTYRINCFVRFQRESCSWINWYPISDKSSLILRGWFSAISAVIRLQSSTAKTQKMRMYCTLFAARISDSPKLASALAILSKKKWLPMLSLPKYRRSEGHTWIQNGYNLPQRLP